MKKLSIILFVLIFFQVTATSQIQTCFPCLRNGITFGTQSQIDSFQIIYPGCTEIEGDVTIKGDDITNLNGLSVVTSIGGSFKISTNPLTSLTGLDNLTSIGGWLEIDENDAMTSLTGLDNLTSIGEYLDMWNNDVLTSLAGLGNLTTIGGLLIIAQHDALTNLAGLDNLTSIGGHFSIIDNVALTSLTGLDNLTSIGWHLGINNNDALTNLAGLDNVTSIGGGLGIVYNDVLKSLSGLDNIAAGSIDSLFIYDNIALSTCEVKSICDYLVNPVGTIEIHDNATGCNSQQEVQEACDTLSVENISFEEGLSIYPNPANTELFIFISYGAIITEVTIYNQIGQKVLHHKPVTQPIDVSMLRKGMYIIEVSFGRESARRKLIVE